MSKDTNQNNPYRIYIHFDSVKKNIAQFTSSFLKTKDSQIIILSGILENAIQRTNDYLNNYFPDQIPNIYKQAGALCFYIRKFKPLIGYEKISDEVYKNLDLLVNERIGWNLGIILIAGYLKEINAESVEKEDLENQSKINKAIENFINKNNVIKNSAYIKILFNNLREGSFSPVSVTFIYWSLFYQELKEVI